MSIRIIQQTKWHLTPHPSRGTLPQRPAGSALIKLSGDRWHLNSQSPLTRRHRCLLITIQQGPILNGQPRSLKLGQRRGPQNSTARVTHGTALRSRLGIGLRTNIRRLRGRSIRGHLTAHTRAQDQPITTAISVLTLRRRKLQTKLVCWTSSLIKSWPILKSTDPR